MQAARNVSCSLYKVFFTEQLSYTNISQTLNILLIEDQLKHSASPHICSSYIYLLGAEKNPQDRIQEIPQMFLPKLYGTYITTAHEPKANLDYVTDDPCSGRYHIVVNRMGMSHPLTKKLLTPTFKGPCYLWFKLSPFRYRLLKYKGLSLWIQL